MDVVSTRRAGSRPGGTGEAPPGEEQPGYLVHRGEQLYTVRHRPVGTPQGRAVLAGPLGDERMHSYITWVRWARMLAGAGFEVVRFDYRGLGESTGRFQDFGLDDWLSDLRRVTEEGGEVEGPVLLCGLRMGALLASHLFAERAGDVLLLWGPPASGREMLTGLLRRKLAEQFMRGERPKERDRSWYIDRLEAGDSVEVNGYPWSRRLWESSAEFPLVLPDAEDPRPWRMIRFDPSTPSPKGHAHHVENVRIQRPPFWQMSPYLVPDVGRLLAGSLAWVTEQTAPQASEPAERERPEAS